MKLFLGIILLILSILISFIMSNKFYFRRVFFNDFATFNRELKQNILFKQNTLIKLINSYQIKSDFFILTKNYIENGQYKFDKKYLTKQELSFFDEYLKLIGVGDKVSQLDFINSVEDIISSKQVQAVNDEKKYKILYIKLGFLIGLILLILVI